jgi:adenine-specific DNA-methyltransferase
MYRPERFQTDFSLKSKAAHALTTLIATSARTGADLVLTYPKNGLALQAGFDVKSALKARFRRVETCYVIDHKHSTFGASKGAAQAQATEVIYLARSA